MKATGIVRRIDDLGRVVIPKEIRRTMRIREGDPLEIYTNAGGEVIFKKYSPMGELTSFAAQYAESLSQSAKMPIIICDRDHCIASAGISKKEVMERRITDTLENIMEERRSILFGKDDEFTALEGVNRSIRIGVPIINSGDICGAIAFLEGDSKDVCDESDMKLATVAANFLAKQVE
ncbi:MAG: AbrB/MazE/SpoVT family DNA-binding domain-containing protein [Clostridia bacterium]|nr:AbrB/MazE/SpoVT family DNA-binding domain-containing protein [Clostridia bacterium]